MGWNAPAARTYVLVKRSRADAEGRMWSEGSNAGKQRLGLGERLTSLQHPGRSLPAFRRGRKNTATEMSVDWEGNHPKCRLDENAILQEVSREKEIWK